MAAGDRTFTPRTGVSVPGHRRHLLLGDLVALLREQRRQAVGADQVSGADDDEAAGVLFEAGLDVRDPVVVALDQQPLIELRRFLQRARASTSRSPRRCRTSTPAPSPSRSPPPCRDPPSSSSADLPAASATADRIDRADTPSSRAPGASCPTSLARSKKCRSTPSSGLKPAACSVGAISVIATSHGFMRWSATIGRPAFSARRFTSAYTSGAMI